MINQNIFSGELRSKAVRFTPAAAGRLSKEIFHNVRIFPVIFLNYVKR